MIHNRGEGVFSPDSSPYNPRHQYTARNAILPYQIYNNTMNTTKFLLCLRTNLDLYDDHGCDGMVAKEKHMDQYEGEKISGPI